MYPILLEILLVITLFVCIGGIIFQAAYLYGGFKTLKSAPFVPVAPSDLEIIIKYLKLTPDAKLYDLGSGDGRILKHAMEHYPTITTVGYEIGPMPRIISKIKLRKYKNKVAIINQNFLTADVHDATHVFLYLFPEVLAKLEPIFDKQLSPGTRVVSIDFVFPTRQPIETVDITGAGKITKQLYVYQW